MSDIIEPSAKEMAKIMNSFERCWLADDFSYNTAANGRDNVLPICGQQYLTVATGRAGTTNTSKPTYETEKKYLIRRPQSRPFEKNKGFGVPLFPGLVS